MSTQPCRRNPVDATHIINSQKSVLQNVNFAKQNVDAAEPVKDQWNTVQIKASHANLTATWRKQAFLASSLPAAKRHLGLGGGREAFTINHRNIIDAKIRLHKQQIAKLETNETQLPITCVCAPQGATRS